MDAGQSTGALIAVHRVFSFPRFGLKVCKVAVEAPMMSLDRLVRCWHVLNHVSKHLVVIAKSTIFSPFVASIIGLVIITRLTGLFAEPDNYLIYFVGPLGGDTSLVKMENIFRKAAARSINGVPIKFEEIDDSGDPAIAQSIATRLASSSDTLMVVGHVLSSTTKDALPIYMKAAPQIPVILTTETNPQILPARADPDQEFSVFRLSLIDDDQALSAYEFAKAKHGETFWVVQGANNAVYTKYLANKFLEDAQCDLTKVLLLSSMINLPAARTVKQLGVQWVFFAGDWQGALTLIREVRALQLSNINFILSDGCASAELLKHGGKDVEGVYIMHQLTAAEFNDVGPDKLQDDNHGYGLYATYALEIIDRLMKKADQRFSELARDEVGFTYMMHQTLRMHRVSDARKVLVKCMNRSMGTPFRMSNGEEFRFRKDATREGARFHVWQITTKGFQDVEKDRHGE
jgi:branched-chain amino acid transport system substrate-binding protein